MKKHLVIICGVMYPLPSATGICTKRLAEMLANDYDIDIICIASDMNTDATVLDSGIGVYALSGGTMKLEAHSGGVIKRLSHICGQMQIKTKFLGNLNWFADAALNKLEEIDRKYKIDAVFSVCSPLSAHFAALRYKEKNRSVRWVAYTVDLYSVPERIRPFCCSLSGMLKKELAVLQGADAVLLSEEIYANHSDLVAKLNAVEKLPYALPEQKKADGKSVLPEREGINCVFAGSFYRDMRNPETVLDIFSRIKDKRIKLHLYSTGCEDLVEKYASECSSIAVHGRVSYEQIQRVYRDANVLLNIGNTNSDFIPSKTFEYIATGKPIVNFYYGKEPDSVLKRYPLAFQISSEAEKFDIQGIEDFLINNGNKAVSRDDIERIYPENTVSFIEQLLTSIIG